MRSSGMPKVAAAICSSSGTTRSSWLPSAPRVRLKAEPSALAAWAVYCHHSWTLALRSGTQPGTGASRGRCSVAPGASCAQGARHSHRCAVVPGMARRIWEQLVA